MKYTIQRTNRFDKDLKLAAKQGKDLSRLQVVIDKLASGEKLDERYRDHALIGNYGGCRECHVTPDWLLVYKIDGDKLVLLLYRLGSHSELFDE